MINHRSSKNNSNDDDDDNNRNNDNNNNKQQQATNLAHGIVAFIIFVPTHKSFRALSRTRNGLGPETRQRSPGAMLQDHSNKQRTDSLNVGDLVHVRWDGLASDTHACAVDQITWGTATSASRPASALASNEPR